MNRAVVVALATMIGCGRVGFDPPGDAGVSGSRSVAFTATHADDEISVTTVSVPVTIGQPPSAVFVSVATRNAGTTPPTVASVTFGGMPLAEIASLCPLCEFDALNDLELWMITDPPIGIGTAVVTLTAQADGASVIVSSYSTFEGMLVDVAGTTNGMSGSPTLSWAPSADSVWSIAAAMDQGGFTMQLLGRTGQIERTPVFCDDDDWEAQTTDDQLMPPGTSSVDFDWTIGGAGAMPCNPTPSSHAWIAIGASFR